MTLSTFKRARTLSAWLLAAFFVRSLIPVGFMPIIGPGHSVQLSLCDAYAPVPMSQPMDMTMDPGMDMSAHKGASPRSHQDHGSCLFGSGPALGAPLAFVALPGVPPLTATAARRTAQVNHYEVPHRAQSARGPPA